MYNVYELIEREKATRALQETLEQSLQQMSETDSSASSQYSSRSPNQIKKFKTANIASNSIHTICDVIKEEDEEDGNAFGNETTWKR